MSKKLSITKTYDAWSKTYDSPNNMLFFMERNHLLKMAGDVKNKKVFDSGCGTGRWAVKFSRRRAKVFGQDISSGMIRKAKLNSKGLKIEYKVGSLNRIKFPTSYFDVIINSLVLNHIKNIGTVFKELSRVLKKNGIIIISTINPFTSMDVVGPRFEYKGKEYWIPSYTHSFEELFKCFKKYNLQSLECIEPKVTDAEKRFFTPEDFKRKKGRRTLLILKLRKK